LLLPLSSLLLLLLLLLLPLLSSSSLSSSEDWCSDLTDERGRLMTGKKRRMHDGGVCLCVFSTNVRDEIVLRGQRVKSKTQLEKEGSFGVGSGVGEFVVA
jgi:hypothetical protein